MLNGGEKDGAVALLRLMNNEDIINLANTVTQNQIGTNSAEDAIHAVVTYSKNGMDLLKRRKLKRNLLFQYLAKSNVVVDPCAGKVQLAKTVLEHWGTSNVDILDLMEIGDDIPPDEANNQAAAEASSRIPNAQATPQPLPNLIQDIPHSSQNHMASQSSSSALGESWIADFMNFEYCVESTSEDKKMGLEFAKWFYEMLNACHPQGLPCTTPFGTQHFFPNCQLKVALVNNKQLETHEGADAVCQKLLQLTQQELVLFNANVDNGVMGFGTSHGLKIFLVCGTLHKDGEMVGVFAQQFGLIRNPDKDFNWNISFTNLKLIAGRPSGPPTLQNPGNIQALPSPGNVHL